MDVKVGLVFVILLVGNWACEARPFTNSDISGSDNKVDVCTLCEVYASLAVKYLTENKTQKEITEALHDACSEFHTLKEQCVALVDQYAIFFFTQLSSVQPDELCMKANICQGKRILSLPEKENSCDVCHHAVDEIIVKLKDPDTQLEILEILLRGCNVAKNYVKKCKAMVFEYGPLIIANAEQYLENTDLCATFHACSSLEQLDAKIMMVTSP